MACNNSIITQMHITVVICSICAFVCP